MSDILRQVDEDLRKDRLLKIWRSYRIHIVGSILAILIFLSGYQYYLSSTQSKNERIVEQYINSINSINSMDINDSIEKLLELNESENPFIKGLSQLKRAELYFVTENKEQAIELLEEISVDESLNQIIRDLALYKYLMIQLNTLDKEIYFKIIDSQDLNVSKFKYLFKELKALKYLIEGDRINSLEIFESIISDESSPIDLKTRSEKFIKISKK